MAKPESPTMSTKASTKIVASPIVDEFPIIEPICFPEVQDPVGLVIVFGRPVTNSFYLLSNRGGIEPQVDCWLLPEHIGDMTKSATYRPPHPLKGGETWGIGISIWPKYYGVAVQGFIHAIEDIVYST